MCDRAVESTGIVVKHSFQGPSLGFSGSLCSERVLGICIFLGSSGEEEAAIWKPMFPTYALSSPGLYSSSSCYQNKCRDPEGEDRLTHMLSIVQSAQLAQA